MTDDELDQYFVDTIKAVLDLFRESADYEGKYNDEAAQDNIEYYQQMISSLEEVCKNAGTIDDLGDFSEDVITDIFDAITAYAEAFIISAEPQQRKTDLQEYEKLEELLYVFCDSDEDDEEDDEE
ncbi:MAG: hypothetical protein MJ184_04450 [Treponema sp.]|uniref:hypothetical protein n=1 Tax=Treponema sp. TaxID=166 RepID=UPI00298E1092|nr:hypothetical protein [Treponema sp.]MCQ2600592.1 hypothetical protein [Treponema sp.]